MRQKFKAESDAIKEVKQVYAELAARPIQRDCIRRTECCQFRVTGRVPFLTRGEAVVAARAFRATGRKELPVRSDGACPMLSAETGRCLIYDGRPFGCRTHFCQPAGGPYERGEVIDLIRRLEAVDAALGGEGARPLAKAVSSAIENG